MALEELAGFTASFATAAEKRPHMQASWSHVQQELGLQGHTALKLHGKPGLLACSLPGCWISNPDWHDPLDIRIVKVTVKPNKGFHWPPSMTTLASCQTWNAVTHQLMWGLFLYKNGRSRKAQPEGTTGLAEGPPFHGNYCEHQLFNCPAWIPISALQFCLSGRGTIFIGKCLEFLRARTLI